MFGSTAIPRGKGLFLRNLLAIGPAEDLVRPLRTLGVRWVLPPSTAPMARLEALGAVLPRAGIEVWPFWWLPPADFEGLARGRERLARARVACRAPGVVLNPERAFRDRPGAALELVAGLPGPVGLATYGIPRNIPDFPWSTLAPRVHFGMPLFMPPEGRRSPAAWWAEAEPQWRDLGVPYLAPVVAAYEARERDLLELQGLSAVAFWPAGPRLPVRYAEAIARYEGAEGPAWWRPLRALARAGRHRSAFEVASAETGV